MINPFSNARIRIVALVTIIAFAMIVIVNFAGVGKSDQLDSFNSIINIVTAGLATTLCWFYWSKLDRADPIEKIWRILGIGLGLWTIAETIWSALILIGGEIQYPSVADILWVIGYIFLVSPFFLLYRLLRINPSARNIAGIFGFAILYSLIVSVYVITPIVQDPESSFVEKTLGALYPIGDLMIALGAAFLALALLGGAFSWVWTLIALGFLAQSFSDTLFTYADWNGLYMPAGASNLISILVDTTYILGYILVAFGIFVQLEFTLHDIEEPLTVHYQSVLDEKKEPATTIKITIFTDETNKIISTSRTIAYLLPPEKNPLELHGVPFNQVVGLDFESARQMLEELKKKGFLSSRTINVLTADSRPMPAQISGLANVNTADIYIGADIILTIAVMPDKVPEGDDHELIDSALRNAHTEPVGDSLEEVLVTTFFLGKIHALYVVISRFGGVNVAKSLQRTFNANAQRLNAQVKMDGPNIVFESKTHDLELYRELLKGIINCAIGLTSLEVISREIDKVEHGLTPDLIKAGKDHGLLGLALEKP